MKNNKKFRVRQSKFQGGNGEQWLMNDLRIQVGKEARMVQVQEKLKDRKLDRELITLFM